MLWEAVREDEIFEAFMLYASLHGLSTDALQARERIARYLDNVPDTVIDLAILAFAEDRILAPPDVVLDTWGKSRVYTLYQTPQLEWRHRVSSHWFDNGCAFYGDDRDPSLCHFWTHFPLSAESMQTPEELCPGMRVRLIRDAEQVCVEHRGIGRVGRLPSSLERELAQWDEEQVKTLSLIDRLDGIEPLKTCTLLVIRATGSIAPEQIVQYASCAFHAVRAAC